MAHLAKLGRPSAAGWLAWSWDEAHEMMLGMLGFVPGVSRKRWRAPALRLNPLYWVAWAASAAMLAGGRLVHALFGQHGKVRPDESHVEHETRVQWIYANDCTYAVSVLLDVWALGREIDLFVWHRHAYDGHHEAVGTLIGLGLLLATIASNVAFYRSMRNRSTAGVRAAIGGNAGFATVMSIALAGAAQRKGLAILKWSWFMRAMAVFFAILALPTYTKLWDGYQEERIGARASLVVTALPFGAVCALMFAAFHFEAQAVWETFG